jgi:signal peptidase I
MRRDTTSAHESRARGTWLRRGGELLALVALTAVLVCTWPQSLGGRVAYIMVSGHSMEPTMHLGDLAVLRRQSTYRVGEIVVYHVPDGEVGAGALVIHRIVGGSARSGFTTRGDHNGYDDPWHPHTNNIVGTRWALLRGAAHYFSDLRGPLPLATFAAALAMVAAYGLLKPRGRPTATPMPGSGCGTHATP